MEENVKLDINNLSSTYEENLKKLGIAFLDDPEIINIYTTIL